MNVPAPAETGASNHKQGAETSPSQVAEHVPARGVQIPEIWRLRHVQRLDLWIWGAVENRVTRDIGGPLISFTESGLPPDFRRMRPYPPNPPTGCKPTESPVYLGSTPDAHECDSSERRSVTVPR